MRRDVRNQNKPPLLDLLTSLTVSIQFSRSGNEITPPFESALNRQNKANSTKDIELMGHTVLIRTISWGKLSFNLVKTFRSNEVIDPIAIPTDDASSIKPIQSKKWATSWVIEFSVNVPAVKGYQQRISVYQPFATKMAFAFIYQLPYKAWRDDFAQTSRCLYD